MRVQLTTERAGVLFTQREGDVIDVPDAEGSRLVRSGQAVPIVESAMVRPIENAAARRQHNNTRKTSHARPS